MTGSMSSLHDACLLCCWVKTKMLTTCARPVEAETTKTSATTPVCEDSPRCVDSLGCTGSFVMASFEEHALMPEGESLATDGQARSNLRFLSLRVPIYERLEREIDERLKQLSLDSRASQDVSAEYRSELEFVQAGLAKAVNRLALEHGVHWRNDVVEVRAPQLREASPTADASGVPSEPIVTMATSLY